MKHRNVALVAAVGSAIVIGLTRHSGGEHQAPGPSWKEPVIDAE